MISSWMFYLYLKLVAVSWGERVLGSWFGFLIEYDLFLCGVFCCEPIPLLLIIGVAIIFLIGLLWFIDLFLYILSI